MSATFNLMLLTYALRKKLSRLGLSLLKQTLLVLIPNAIFAAVIAWALGSMWEKRFGHATLPLKIAAVFVPGGIASLLYWLVAVWAKVPAAHDLFLIFKRRIGQK
jgi:peptidoglycan biosynthesis protein MviN/MurJ (putative lipid II flippase)